MFSRPTKKIFSIGWGIIPNEPRYVVQLGTRAARETKISEIIENATNTKFGVEYDVYHSPDGKTDNQTLFMRYTKTGIPQFIKYDETDAEITI